MGLDAVVYKNRKNIELGSDEKFARLVPETGQTYFDDDEISGKHRAQLRALHIRLGNVSEVAILRSELTRLPFKARIIGEKVLYSGSHSGDFITLIEMNSLQNEIKTLRKAKKTSREFQTFLDSLEALVQAAITENNPIAFI